jgi:hypothetical protein
MKFFELAVGDEFILNDARHVKVKEERISCCKVGCNAKLTTDPNSKVVVTPLQDVVKVAPEATT